MEASSSSKVTVEYHDPSGIFPLVSRDLAARLPLRNLNWQSPSRPLRQIRSLHVDFVPDKDTQDALRPGSAQSEANGVGPNSLEIVRSGRDPKKDAVKERRHQIPGLKTSSYLKIYVLRCDDKDVYKDHERSKIREWIREHASSDGKRDNHDAFEWLILHVVIPDTPSASEPRWREVSSKDLDEFKERPKSSAKWPGKSLRTVFDRLRADFNESSKTGPDRIAQIRLRKNDVPADLLPTPALATTLEETPQERENAWNDLMTKFKALLLGPFDLRVRQYEADIAQQEARRSLPGWNFCTFFIHKEGLAKALESIGLIEDALAIYDELALGLETVVRDVASGQADGTATTFAEYTDDIRDRILGLKLTTTTTTNGRADEKDRNHEIKHASDLFNKDYREKIVRSSISTFDFFCYLFSRQKMLILRLANTRASQAALGASGVEGGEDLVLISEVCWRASNFIHNNARTLRRDLSNAQHADIKPAEIDGLVCSWTYAVAQQVLDETAASALDSTTTHARPDTPNGTPQRPVDFSFGMGADPYPQRKSSLSARKPPLPELKARTDSGNVSSHASNRATIEIGAKSSVPGQPELAAYRAELLVMQRKMLEQLAASKSWRVGWEAMRHADLGRLDEIDFRAEGANEKPEDVTDVACSSGSTLISGLDSEVNFHATYEYLTDLMMRHYAVATQVKTVQAAITDLAMLKYQQNNWEAAVSYFQHILPTLDADGWNLVLTEVHSAYAECLKKLKKKEEYVDIALGLLAKTVSKSIERVSATFRGGIIEDHLSDHAGVFSDVVECSSGLTNVITRPMDQYFPNIDLDHEVIHHKDRDGFTLRLQFHHVLRDTVKADKITARLVALDDPNHEIWLASPSVVELTPGTVQVNLEASAVASGPFLVDRIVLKAQKLEFVQEMQPRSEVPRLMIAETELTSAINTSTTAHLRPFVYLYPAVESFNIDAALSKEMFIDRSRHLELKLESGWNNVQELEIKLRSLSAGLRLHCGEAKVEGIDRRGNESPTTPGQILLGGLDVRTTGRVSVPYTLEQLQSSISVRLEARYRTVHGVFVLLRSVKLSSELPLDVDVDDVFHLRTLYSTFTIRSTNEMPILVTGAALNESPAYSVEAPPQLPFPMTVFHRQPARVVYKISPKQDGDGHKHLSRRDVALALSVRYQSIEGLVAVKLAGRFAEDLQQSSFASLSRLLGPVLAERAQSTFTAAAMTLVALLKKVKLPSYEEVGWHDIIQTLPNGVQLELSRWLQTWHSRNASLAVEPTQADADAESCITIVVDVPTVDFVHSASLSLLNRPPAPTQGPTILRLGQDFAANLRLRHTDAWSTKRVNGTTAAKATDSTAVTKTFVYDIQADADTWLIDGPRRAHFTARPGEEQVFPIVLIPLRLGCYALPTLDVQGEAFKTTADEDGTPPAKAAPTVSCETHVESAGQIVQVIRDLRTSRVHIVETGYAAAPSAVAATTATRTSTPTPGSVTSG